MGIFRTGAFAAMLAATSLASPARALDEIPAYAVTEIGSALIAAYSGVTYSTATAVNESGDAVGWAIVNGDMRAFIYTAESGAELLPLFPGYIAGQAVDISDRDGVGEAVIVGTTRTSTYDEPGTAALWIYDTAAGAVVEQREIGMLPDGFNSALTAITPDGSVAVGFTALPLSGRGPMIYDVALDLLEPLDFPERPVDINAAGQIAGGRFILETDGTVTDLGHPPEHFPTSVSAISDAGWAVGSSTTFFTDGNGRYVNAAVRHSGAWEVLWQWSAWDGAIDINTDGDLIGQLGVSGAVRPMLRLEGLGTFLLQDLLGPGYRDKAVVAALGMNDAVQIAGSGTGGAVLLTSTGPMPVPEAPQNLTAVPHLPTWQQPWNAITLNWTDVSELDQGFYVERSLAGANAWTEIKANWSNMQLWDMEVGFGVTYDYRVRSRGVAGYSDYSNIATATAPSEPVDRTAPVATILSPADGAEVSGNVSISFEVTDNADLSYVELSTTVNSSSVNICSQSVSGSSFSTTCTWRTRKVAAGDYPIRLYASDAMGNWTSTQITVTLGESTKGGGGGGGGPKCNPKKGC
jgi:hypothetical protein